MIVKIQTGYTLVELMVVVAIIGIIGAIAYPSYQGYMQDTYRSQAVADLKLCALGMERHYSDNFTYAGAVVDTSAATVCSAQSPRDGTAQYDLSLESSSTTNFTLRATPASGSCIGNQCMEVTADGTLTETSG